MAVDGHSSSSSRIGTTFYSPNHPPCASPRDGLFTWLSPVEQEVCGSWAGRKGLVAVRSGERVVGVDRVMLGECSTGKHGRWTDGDTVMLWVMVETRVSRAVRCGHGEYQLENRSAQKGSRSAGQGQRGSAGTGAAQRR